MPCLGVNLQSNCSPLLQALVPSGAARASLARKFEPIAEALAIMDAVRPAVFVPRRRRSGRNRLRLRSRQSGSCAQRRAMHERATGYAWRGSGRSISTSDVMCAHPDGRVHDDRISIARHAIGVKRGARRRRTRSRELAWMEAASSIHIHSRDRLRWPACILYFE